MLLEEVAVVAIQLDLGVVAGAEVLEAERMDEVLRVDVEVATRELFVGVGLGVGVLALEVRSATLLLLDLWPF
eukprot:15467171-Alexandrium_andersonii.AAC.1